MTDNDVLCECGVPSRLIKDQQFHIRSGNHTRAMRVKICVRCFYNDCKNCEPRRGRWMCLCDHDYSSAFGASPEVKSEQDEAFEVFLVAGAPSSNGR
jgi:hypothetical protein